MSLLRPWHLLLVALALFVPIQAGALSGGGAAGLGVSASLGQCGVSEAGIVCRIDASWNGVEGAYRYTASMTLADGSVQDMGAVGYGSGGGSTSLWVPYAGDGTYTVTVTAWGTDERGHEKKVGVDKGKAQLKEPADDAGAEDDQAEQPDEGFAEGADPVGGQQGDGADSGPAAEPEAPAEEEGDPPAEKPADPTPEPDAPADEEQPAGIGGGAAAGKTPPAADSAAADPGI